MEECDCGGGWGQGWGLGILFVDHKQGREMWTCNILVGTGFEWKMTFLGFLLKKIFSTASATKYWKIKENCFIGKHFTLCKNRGHYVVIPFSF